MSANSSSSKQSPDVGQWTGSVMGNAEKDDKFFRLMGHKKEKKAKDPVKAFVKATIKEEKKEDEAEKKMSSFEAWMEGSVGTDEDGEIKDAPKKKKKKKRSHGSDPEEDAEVSKKEKKKKKKKEKEEDGESTTKEEVKVSEEVPVPKKPGLYGSFVKSNNTASEEKKKLIEEVQQEQDEELSLEDQQKKEAEKMKKISQQILKDREQPEKKHGTGWDKKPGDIPAKKFKHHKEDEEEDAESRLQAPPETGQWAAAKVKGNDDSRNEKFFRLMGGFKKSAKTFSAGMEAQSQKDEKFKRKFGHALGEQQVETLESTLESQFESARQNKFSHRGKGLGFSSMNSTSSLEPSTAPKKFHIDKNSSSSIKFDD